ncbi:hypothetical protein OL548_17175 [Lysinibacillus sp. MHQ-1]|nr:hypothetical protein OL548_17175 [Lysinibacillus sp. MHQ-1]
MKKHAHICQNPNIVKKNTSSVTHFYEKLLLLKDLMVTEKGKQMALERHQFMESFLQQLQHEIGQ